jgi:hypothetical protein
MNVAQIKDEIRNLSQIDKIELFTWIDREVSDLLCRIGSSRSLQIRREIECKVTGPKKSGRIGKSDHLAVNYASQASPHFDRNHMPAISGQDTRQQFSPATDSK